MAQRYDRRRAVAYVPAHGDGQAIDAGRLGGARLDVFATVREQSDGVAPRARLGAALQPIADGDASVLLVARLADAAGSAHELVALLDWLEAAAADLLALDVRLDTGSAAGRRTVAALREVERWKHEPPAGRPPRGRPGLSARAPELAERIAAMRDRGHSLQAIADALNQDGVPTQRGGARWRPSSVQAALGYRRPRAPLHGAPPPPPPPAPPADRRPDGPPHPPRGPAASPPPPGAPPRGAPPPPSGAPPQPPRGGRTRRERGSS